MLRRLRVLVVTAMLAGAVTAAGATISVPAANDVYMPNEVIVGVAAGGQVEAIANRLGARVDRALRSGDAFVLTVGSPTAAAALARSLPGVRYAEPNWIRTLHSHGASPDDSDFHLKWDLHNDGSLADGSDRPTAGADIGFLGAYAALVGTSLQPTVVAVLDTGVDAGHPDLDGKLVPGWDYVSNDATPQDGYGHGTHVAGIAAAETNNGIGTAGVGFHADIRIMPIKVCSDTGSCPSDAIANGIHHAADNGASVINLSLGGTEISQAEIDAIAYADSENVLIVASAGNSNVSTLNYPAAHEPVMAIAATDWDDQKASYSNYGGWVDLAAPGGDMSGYDDPEGIYSTMPTYGVYLTSCRARGLLSPCYDLHYDQLQGTSMAAPQVAGAAALLYAMGVATHDEVRSLLQAESDPLADFRLGAGRLDVGKAVAAVGGVDPAPTVQITTPADGATVKGTVPVTATASADVLSVAFSVDGVVIGTDSDGSDGWSASWDTTGATDGSHTVAAVGTDEAGQTASHSVTVTVDNVVDPAITLSVVAYKVRGVQQADLSWSGATGLDVDVYRDGSLIFTTANDGSVTDNIGGRGGGTFVYVVCEVGSTVCSNEATASY